MSTPELTTAYIKFGTLFEVNPKYNSGMSSRVDMVTEPTSSKYFYSIQTRNNENEKLMLIPTGSGTAYPKYVGSILPEKIGFLESLSAYKRGLLFISGGKLKKIPPRIILSLWSSSRMPPVEIEYVEIPEERYIP